MVPPILVRKVATAPNVIRVFINWKFTSAEIPHEKKQQKAEKHQEQQQSTAAERQKPKSAQKGTIKSFRHIKSLLFHWKRRGSTDFAVALSKNNNEEMKTFNIF